MFQPSGPIYNMIGAQIAIPDSNHIISAYQWDREPERLERYRSDHIVIFCHGNGGNLSWYTPWMYRLSRIHVLLFDYPGYGHSTGKPTETSVLQSGLDVYDYVKSLGYRKIYCYGFSLGGAVALHIAKHRLIDGLVLQSTFANISDCVPFIGPLVAGSDFNSILNAPLITCKTMVSHSPSDEIVPYWSARQLYSQLNCQKYFYDLDHKHNTTPENSDYYDFIFNMIYV